MKQQKRGRGSRPGGRVAMESRPGGRFAFFREAWSEYKKVVWPSRRDTVRLTAIVVVISVTLGLILGGIDFGFTRLIDILAGVG
jgi:preprotein translocase subunit SecE